MCTPKEATIYFVGVWNTAHFQQYSYSGLNE
jgi:hypothetical protein